MAERYFEHVTQEGERWDLLAHRFFGTVRMQSALIAANRDVLVRPGADGAPTIVAPPAVLPAGLVLRVPVVEAVPDNGALPPWKRGAPRVPGSRGAGA